MAKFKTGQSGNPAERPQGAANLFTRELRSTLKDIISDELEQIPDLLKDMEPEKRLDFIIKLMVFCLPRVQPVSSTSGEPLDMDLMAI